MRVCLCEMWAEGLRDLSGCACRKPPWLRKRKRRKQRPRFSRTLLTSSSSTSVITPWRKEGPPPHAYTGTLNILFKQVWLNESNTKKKITFISILQCPGSRSLVYRIRGYDGKGMSDIVSSNRWLYLRWERDFHRTVHVSDGRTRQWWSDMVALQSCAEDEEEEEEEGKEKTFEVYTWGRIPLFMQRAQKDTDVTSPCRRDYARMARLWNPISLLSRVIKVLALATYLTELETNTCPPVERGSDLLGDKLTLHQDC